MLSNQQQAPRRTEWTIEDTLLCLSELLSHRPRREPHEGNGSLRALAAVGGADAAVLVDDRGKAVSSTPPRYTVTRELARWYAKSSLRGLRAPHLLRAGPTGDAVFSEPWARESGVQAIGILPGLSPTLPHFTLLVMWRRLPPELSEPELWALSLATGVLVQLPAAG